MPRIKRKLLRRNESYGEFHVMQLLHGNAAGFESFAFGWERSFDEAAAREAWQIMGPELLEDWIRERAGSRPWGWWRWQAPERRQRIDGGLHPHDDPLRQQKIELTALDNPRFRDIANGLSFGVPSCYIGDDAKARFEGELAYLDRLGLLEPSEKKELFGED